MDSTIPTRTVSFGQINCFAILDIFSFQRLKKDSLSVAIDGTLYKKHPTFKRFMHQALEELVPTTVVHLQLAEDGSGRGAAVVAAVADRLSRSNAEA